MKKDKEFYICLLILSRVNRVKNRMEFVDLGFLIFFINCMIILLISFGYFIVRVVIYLVIEWKV